MHHVGFVSTVTEAAVDHLVKSSQWTILLYKPATYKITFTINHLLHKSLNGHPVTQNEKKMYRKASEHLSQRHDGGLSIVRVT